MGAALRRRVREAPIVERSEQEPPEAKRRPATQRAISVDHDDDVALLDLVVGSDPDLGDGA